MSSLNKMQLIGHLGGDPETKAVRDRTVCTFSVATSEQWKDNDGKKQERTEWTRVVVWGALADTCAKYLKKGRQVYVEGRKQTREWTDEKNGNIKRQVVECVAHDVQFLDGGSRSGSGKDQKAEDRSSPGDRPAGPPPDDEIPF